MSKKFEQLAKDLIPLIGGKENIEGLHHCQTRLRFKLKDDSVVDDEAVSKLDGVLQTINKGGMYQVVVGMDVAEAYEEVIKLIGDVNSNSSEEAPKEKQNLFNTVTDFISSIFSPIVPALAGAGMVKAFLAFLVAFSLIDNTSMTYQLLTMIGDATFCFMPILLAYTTADKIGSNKILAAVTAGIMCHPTWATLVAGAAETPIRFFGVIPFYAVKYTNSVIPIILVILVQKPIEKFLNKHIPASIRLVFAPMLEMLIMATLAFAILGPAGDYVGMAFTSIFTFLSETVGWLELGVLAGVFAILVTFGLHHGISPIGVMQMSQMGYDGVFGPAALLANIGQGTASLVAGLLSKDSKTKQIGVAAGITGLMGTTEPALYGINLPKKYPLIAGSIGAACGGLYAGIMHVHRFATGSSGLPAVVMYIGDGTMYHFYNILIAMGITAVVTVVLTFIFFKKFDGKNAVVNADESKDVAAEETVSTVTDEVIVSPVKGKALPLSQSKDSVFAQEMMGKGAVVEPEEGTVYAPCTGEVVTLFPTGHAVGIKSESGAEVLIHIGIDTVNLGGKGFEALVKQGDKVTAGQKLVNFDLNEIKAAGYETQTMVIITNTAEYSDISLVKEGTVNVGDELVEVNK